MNSKRIRFVSILLTAALILPGSVLAQQPGGGSRPSPSMSGGSAGGPGMSGAGMTGGGASRSGSMPSGGGLPSGGGSGLPSGGGTGERPQIGSGAGSGLPSGSGTGERPEGSAFSGFSGFSSDGEGLAGRFGERGSGTLPIELPFSAEGGWMDQFSAGGFGSRGRGGAEGEEPPNGGVFDANTRPDSLPTDIPEAPGAYEDLSGLGELQSDTWTAVEEALMGANGEYADQVTQAAQDAYDQLWTDYYTAVDYTAQVYYDTVTATADYMLQSYYAAVDTTTQTVDYYLAYYDQYMYYCSLYPWDCYSYAYDAVTYTYYYVGDVSSAPTGTTTVGQVPTNVTIMVEPPTPSAEAYEAIVLFANDQLGAVVEPLYAGTVTAEIDQMIQLLPEEMQAFMLNSLEISGTEYWGMLTGGAASVMVGDCAGCVVTTDTLSMQLSSASMGAYAIRASAAVPTTAEEALRLITTVYPKLTGLSFAQITDVDGLAFTATTASLGTDVNGQPISAAKVVYAGVVNVNGAPYVYAMVAVGEGYADVFVN